MTDANLFQLGIGLETGAHEEDTASGVPTAIVNSLVDADREDHFIRRNGKVFAQARI